MSTLAHIDRLTLIGTGLIGGSLALGLKQAGFVGEIVGCGRRGSQLQRALELGVIDRSEPDPAAAVAGAGLVVVCVPVLAMPAIFAAIAPAMRPDAVLTDVGSTKQSVIDAAQQAFGELPAGFVPGHPIAGTEHSGVEAAFATLYQQRLSILTPTPASSESAIATVQAMWQACGARVAVLDAEHHDDVLAATSHLPHVLAFALVDLLASRADHDEVFAYAAGGFRDFTRIASSSPDMWRDIASANRHALTQNLDALIERLQGLRAAIAVDDRRTVHACFSRAKQARDNYVDLVEEVQT
ncbi:prephenate dehydrogenase/arogenate dehydrogenase family protein [bacterium]|nr:prephenate dehydrogenase/arogenate dehydrogenase family protein [bacterium]